MYNGPRIQVLLSGRSGGGYLPWYFGERKSGFEATRTQRISWLEEGLLVLSVCTAVACGDIKEKGFST